MMKLIFQSTYYLIVQSIEHNR